MNLVFQSILKDSIVKLFWFRPVLLGFVSFRFVSFRFVEYNKPPAISSKLFKELNGNKFSQQDEQYQFFKIARMS